MKGNIMGVELTYITSSQFENDPRYSNIKKQFAGNYDLYLNAFIAYLKETPVFDFNKKVLSKMDLTPDNMWTKYNNAKAAYDEHYKLYSETKKSLAACRHEESSCENTFNSQYANALDNNYGADLSDREISTLKDQTGLTAASANTADAESESEHYLALLENDVDNQRSALTWGTFTQGYMSYKA